MSDKNKEALCFRRLFGNESEDGFISLTPFENKKYFTSGLSLVELIVAVALFLIILSISLTSLFTLTTANQRSQSNRKTADNLTFALEDMVRTVRVGGFYHCGATSTLAADLAATDPLNLLYIGHPRDCGASVWGVPWDAGSYLALESFGGDAKTLTDQIIYRLNSSSGKGVIEKSTNGGVSFFPLSTSDIDVKKMNYLVYGSDYSDGIASRVLVSIQATLDPGKKTQTDFNIQTTIMQRSPDF